MSIPITCQSTFQVHSNVHSYDYPIIPLVHALHSICTCLCHVYYILFVTSHWLILFVHPITYHLNIPLYIPLYLPSTFHLSTQSTQYNYISVTKSSKNVSPVSAINFKILTTSSMSLAMYKFSKLSVI